MWGRIRVILRKEILQVLREPRMRAMLVGPPLIQLIVFGYAVNLDVENNFIAWMDRDRSPESRELAASLQGSPFFRIVATPESEEEVQDLLERSQVRAVVRVLPGFSTKIRQGNTATVQVLLDGTDSNTATIVMNYVNRVVARMNSTLWEKQQRRMMVGPSMESGGPVALAVPRIEVARRVWFNPDLRSQDYFIPGVVANIIALVTVLLTSMAVVREKELGTMEQLMVSPIRPVELMLGKTLPFALIGIVEVMLVTGVALFLFGIPFRGSAVLLLFCSVLFLMTTLGAGLLISTLSHTQQQAMMGTFFFFLPTFMLSGFTFPIRNMPVLVQYLTYLNPIRYFLEISRGIFLKGVGAEVLWPQMLALFLFGLGMIVLSSLRFHKRLE